MLTGKGLGVVAATVAASVGAVTLHYPELGVLAAGGAVALMAGLGWVARPPRLEVRRTVEPVRVERGRTALGLLLIRNQNRIALSPTVAVERCGPTSVAVDIPRLAHQAAKRVTYPLPTDRRALVQIGPLTVTRRDPLGLWRTSQRTGSIEQLWVHPVVHAVHGSPTGRTRSLDGPDTDQVPQGSITFHALREYVIGDDLRHIHWRSSARFDQLMVREHVDTTLPQVTLLLDTSEHSFDPDHFEEAVEAVASVAVAATRNRYPVRIVTTSGRSAGARGIHADTQYLLDLLSEIDLTAEGTLRDVIPLLASERRTDVLMVVTGAPEPDDLVAISAFIRRFDRGVVGIVTGHPEEVPVPVSANTVVLRASTGRGFVDAWNASMGR